MALLLNPAVLLAQPLGLRWVTLLLLFKNHLKSPVAKHPSHPRCDFVISIFFNLLFVCFCFLPVCKCVLAWRFGLNSLCPWPCSWQGLWLLGTGRTLLPPSSAHEGSFRSSRCLAGLPSSPRLLSRPCIIRAPSELRTKGLQPRGLDTVPTPQAQITKHQANYSPPQPSPAPFLPLRGGCSEHNAGCGACPGGVPRPWACPGRGPGGVAKGGARPARGRAAPPLPPAPRGWRPRTAEPPRPQSGGAVRGCFEPCPAELSRSEPC